MRPFLSIDAESTGLEKQKVEVLEVGYVLDDLVNPVATLPKKCMVLKHASYGFSTAYALKLNARLIDAQLDPAVVKLSARQVFETLLADTKYVAGACANWDESMKQRPVKKVSYAGKNVVGFDIPLLTSFFLRNGMTEAEIAGWQSFIHYRSMDAGSIFYPRFGYVPGLDEINKMTGRNAVSHNALEDALDVVYAVRFSLGINT